MCACQWRRRWSEPSTIEMITTQMSQKILKMTESDISPYNRLSYFLEFMQRVVLTSIMVVAWPTDILALTTMAPNRFTLVSSSLSLNIGIFPLCTDIQMTPYLGKACYWQSLNPTAFVYIYWPYTYSEYKKFIGRVLGLTEIMTLCQKQISVLK